MLWKITTYVIAQKIINSFLNELLIVDLSWISVLYIISYCVGLASLCTKVHIKYLMFSIHFIQALTYTLYHQLSADALTSLNIFCDISIQFIGAWTQLISNMEHDEIKTIINFGVLTGTICNYFNFIDKFLFKLQIYQKNITCIILSLYQYGVYWRCITNTYNGWKREYIDIKSNVVWFSVIHSCFTWIIYYNIKQSNKHLIVSVLASILITVLSKFNIQSLFYSPHALICSIYLFFKQYNLLIKMIVYVILLPKQYIIFNQFKSKTIVYIVIVNDMCINVLASFLSNHFQIPDEYIYIMCAVWLYISCKLMKIHNAYSSKLNNNLSEINLKNNIDIIINE